MKPTIQRGVRPLARHTLALALAGAFGAAHAFGIDAGNPDLKVRWDTTVQYGAAYRLKNSDPIYLGTNNANGDDGERNFGKGVVSNRVDLSSEFDAVHSSGFGLRLSAAAWYDSVYNTRNDNPGFAGHAFPNRASAAFNEFTPVTRDLHGRKAEVRDAFVFGKFSVGNQQLTARLGRHALTWGESVFLVNNAIAGAMSPFDISRVQADPTAQAKEFVMPVPQVSAQLQVTDDIAIGAYYQFRYRANRLPAVGSYFSTSDVFVDGAEQLLLGPLGAAPREPDVKAKNSGQGGLQLRWRLGETDLGFYAMRFHDKGFATVTRIGFRPGVGPVPVSYYLASPEGITAYGLSASRTFGDANLAIEASVRRNQTLASSHATDLSGVGFGPATNNNSSPAYATGKTAHVNASVVLQMPSTFLWTEAGLIGELGWNRLLSCERNCSTALDHNATRDAVALRAVLTPTYRQVLPGLDLDVPIGVGWTPKGSRSSLGPVFTPTGGGDFTLGLNGTYLSVWRINLAYTHYFGPSAPALDATNSFSYLQTMKGRDFLALNVRRTF